MGIDNALYGVRQHLLFVHAHLAVGVLVVLLAMLAVCKVRSRSVKSGIVPPQVPHGLNAARRLSVLPIIVGVVPVTKPAVIATRSRVVRLSGHANVPLAHHVSAVSSPLQV